VPHERAPPFTNTTDTLKKNVTKTRGTPSNSTKTRCTKLRSSLGSSLNLQSGSPRGTLSGSNAFPDASVHEAGPCGSGKQSLVGEHPCATCGATFALNSNLAKHMRTHTGDRPYPCPTCGKAFVQSSDLARHARTHAGDRPYACTKCGKGFSRSDNLARHLSQDVCTGSRLLVESERCEDSS